MIKASNWNGYGWFVVAACFLCCLSYGTFYAFGIFFRPLQEQFGWTSTMAFLIWSISFLLAFAVAFISKVVRGRRN